MYYRQPLPFNLTSLLQPAIDALDIGPKLYAFHEVQKFKGDAIVLMVFNCALRDIIFRQKMNKCLDDMLRET